MTRHCSEVERE